MISGRPVIIPIFTIQALQSNFNCQEKLSRNCNFHTTKQNLLDNYLIITNSQICPVIKCFARDPTGGTAPDYCHKAVPPNFLDYRSATAHVGTQEVACRRCHTLHVHNLQELQETAKHSGSKTMARDISRTSIKLSSCCGRCRTLHDADSHCIYIHCLLTNMDINISLNTTKAIVNDTV